MPLKLGMLVDMHGIHTHARFHDLDFENVGKACPACYYVQSTNKTAKIRKHFFTAAVE